MSELAVTAVGADRPGIVAAVAEVLHQRGGNVEDSAMTILGGHFAIVLIVAGDDDADELRHALEEATSPLGLAISVSRADGRRRPQEPTHLLSVYGADRPGIVAGVTRAIADLGANITDLETQVIGHDEPVYAMVIEVVADDEDALEQRLSAVCGELGVDHTLRTIEAETY
ncbi:glycine cleavage system protein R [Egicoccus sp. AB-alg6-2]|uniref:glycine cleavage system protein R n=1 Tax=Egicoccus sp. AB-alg6-2 TaxID=3242692 RepID=UPI00359E8182